MISHSYVSKSAVAIAATILLAGCASSSAGNPSTAPADPALTSVTASDPWVKAAEAGMSAAFMTLSNPTDSEQVLVSASTPVSPMVELHEMVMQDGQMVMQEKAGGIAIPANGTAVLEPGGNHIMLMDITSPVKPGDSVPLTLTFGSGLTLEVTAVGRDFAGAEESYDPSPSMSGG